MTTCNKFEQAVDALITTVYDLFITDIDMPGASVFKGVELLGFDQTALLLGGDCYVRLQLEGKRSGVVRAQRARLYKQTA